MADAAVLTMAIGIAFTTPLLAIGRPASENPSPMVLSSSAATTQTTLTVSFRDRSTIALLCKRPSTPPAGCGGAENSWPVALSNSVARLCVRLRDALIVSIDTVRRNLFRLRLV
eukprot:scaffold407_cov251-Pinguiococcus_pyrenoidosus.AAC.15